MHLSVISTFGDSPAGIRIGRLDFFRRLGARLSNEKPVPMWGAAKKKSLQPSGSLAPSVPLTMNIIQGRAFCKEHGISPKSDLSFDRSIWIATIIERVVFDCHERTVVVTLVGRQANELIHGLLDHDWRELEMRIASLLGASDKDYRDHLASMKTHLVNLYAKRVLPAMKSSCLAPHNYITWRLDGKKRGLISEALQKGVRIAKVVHGACSGVMDAELEEWFMRVTKDEDASFYDTLLGKEPSLLHSPTSSFATSGGSDGFNSQSSQSELPSTSDTDDCQIRGRSAETVERDRRVRLLCPPNLRKRGLRLSEEQFELIDKLEKAISETFEHIKRLEELIEEQLQAEREYLSSLFNRLLTDSSCAASDEGAGSTAGASEARRSKRRTRSPSTHDAGSPLLVKVGRKAHAFSPRRLRPAKDRGARSGTPPPLDTRDSTPPRKARKARVKQAPRYPGRLSPSGDLQKPVNTAPHQQLESGATGGHTSTVHTGRLPLSTMRRSPPQKSSSLFVPVGLLASHTDPYSARMQPHGIHQTCVQSLCTTSDEDFDTGDDDSDEDFHIKAFGQKASKRSITKGKQPSAAFVGLGLAREDSCRSLDCEEGNHSFSLREPSPPTSHIARNFGLDRACQGDLEARLLHWDEDAMQLARTAYEHSGSIAPAPTQYDSFILLDDEVFEEYDSGDRLPGHRSDGSFSTSAPFHGQLGDPITLEPERPSDVATQPTSSTPPHSGQRGYGKRAEPLRETSCDSASRPGAGEAGCKWPGSEVDTNTLYPSDDEDVIFFGELLLSRGVPESDVRRIMEVDKQEAGSHITPTRNPFGQTQDHATAQRGHKRKRSLSPDRRRARVRHSESGVRTALGVDPASAPLSKAIPTSFVGMLAQPEALMEVDGHNDDDSGRAQSSRAEPSLPTSKTYLERHRNAVDDARLPADAPTTSTVSKPPAVEQELESPHLPAKEARTNGQPAVKRGSGSRGSSKRQRKPVQRQTSFEVCVTVDDFLHNFGDHSLFFGDSDSSEDDSLTTSPPLSNENAAPTLASSTPPNVQAAKEAKQSAQSAIYGREKFPGQALPA